MIRLRDDIAFEDPESRIREYCEIEEYQGYDDRHNINNLISQEDIDAANNLYAMIDRYDKTESRRLLSRSERIRETLSKVPNKNIDDLSQKEWIAVKNDVHALLKEFLLVRGIGLAKATKILHLKSPNLFPILDRLVIKLLLDIDISTVEKDLQLKIGLQALERTREIMTDQEAAFTELANQTQDLPISLTPIRLFDILCWTAQKWDIEGNLTAPYGTPHKSLLHSLRQVETTESVSSTVKVEQGTRDRFVVFEDLERATGPKVHAVTCVYYQRWLRRRTKTTAWYGPFASKEKAWNKCRNIALRHDLSPSKHNCVTH